MKVLYIGDNRNRGNFGCRATSTALSMLIKKSNTVTGVISGKFTDQNISDLFYYTFLPGWAYTFFSKHQTIRFCFEKITNKLGYKRSDYVSSDFEKSLKNLKRCLPCNKELGALLVDNYDFDALVVNGEGSFIFSTPAWREPLVLSLVMYQALKLNKKVFFANAMLSDQPYSAKNIETINAVEKILSRCDAVVVRENESLAYCKNNLPSVSPILVPDALFSWNHYINDTHKVENYRYYIAHDSEKDSLYEDIDFSKPYILVSSSSSGKIWNKKKSIPAYVNLVNTLKHRFMGGAVYLIQTCEGDEILHEVSRLSNTHLIPMKTPLLAVAKILANAACFVSGRYHPAIMASQGGTPCVFMTSNSHKTHSLQELLRYENVLEYPVIPSDNDVAEMVELAMKYVTQGEELRSKIKSRAFELYNESLKIAEIIK